MQTKVLTIWLIRSGVLLAHVALFILIARQTIRTPEKSSENPVFVTLTLPPHPEDTPPQMDKTSETAIGKDRAPRKKKTRPVKEGNTAGVLNTDREESVPGKGGPVVVFAPMGTPVPKTALGSVLRSLACVDMDGKTLASDCQNRSVNLMQGYDDEIKRVTQSVDKMLYIAAGSPEIRVPYPSLINRDPMASINLRGGQVFDLEAAKELEALHKYKDPAFGD